MELRQEWCPAPTDLALETVRAWTIWLTAVARPILPRFPRRAARRRAWASSRRVLSPVERKNSWQWAAVHGDATPYGGQHLLGRAPWDAEALRDAVRPYVVEPLRAPQAVLGVDETGFLPKGQQAAGGARHDSGTAGRVAHGHMGVVVTSATPQGPRMLARALYLPKEWTHDAPRCTGAGIPAARLLAPQPPLAPQRLQRAFDHGVPAAGVTGASVYGDHRSRRLWLAEHRHAHVLAVSGQAYVWRAGRQQQGKTLLAALAAAGWWRLRAGDGAKGPRWDDWPGLPLATPRQPRWRRWLWVRRSLSAPTELTAYVVLAPQVTVLATVVQVAGSRWPVERCFDAATGEGGLEQ